MSSVSFEYYIYAVARELEKATERCLRDNPEALDMEIRHYQAHAVCNLLEDLVNEARACD